MAEFRLDCMSSSKGRPPDARISRCENVQPENHIARTVYRNSMPESFDRDFEIYLLEI